MNSQRKRRHFVKDLSAGFLLMCTLKLGACGSDDSLTPRRATTADQLPDENILEGNKNQQDSTKIPQPGTNQDNLEDSDTSTQENEDLADQAELDPEIKQPIKVIEVWDTYAVALYYDGTHGPKTGTLTVEELLSEEPTQKTFWHGHGGRDHRYVISNEDKSKLKNGEKVVIETDSVDGHTHTLFIDPVDPKYQVEGSDIVEVEIYA